MADWMDWLEGISGAASGVAKGFDAGIAPLASWEKVRTADVANDLSDIRNRDALLTQQALEGRPDFYGNLAAFRDIANQKGFAQGTSDIWGLDQKLAMNKALSDPMGAFQTQVRERGLLPTSAEYRKLFSDAMGEFDPYGAIGAADKMGIPGIEQRTINEQAVAAVIQQWAQQYDPGATVVRTSEGALVVLDSNGNPTPVSGAVLVKAAAMLRGPDPYSAISTGLRDEVSIQKANADLVKAYLSGQMRPADFIRLLEQQRQSAIEVFDVASRDLRAFDAQAAKSFEDPATLAQQRAALAQRVELARQAVEGVSRQAQTVIEGGGSFAGPPSYMAGPGAPGGSQVTTRRPPISDQVSRAGGGAARPPPRVGNGPMPQIAPPSQGTTPRTIEGANTFWGVP